jgi:hypothetical protein
MKGFCYKLVGLHVSRILHIGTLKKEWTYILLTELQQESWKAYFVLNDLFSNNVVCDFDLLIALDVHLL